MLYFVKKEEKLATHPNCPFLHQPSFWTTVLPAVLSFWCPGVNWVAEHWCRDWAF